MEKQKIINKNYIFIILLGVLGMCFGLLDWDGVISDILYLKFEDKVLISIIASGISIAKIIATILCIKITQTRRTNLVFYVCMILSAITVVLSAIFFENNLVVGFSIFFLLNILVMEVFAGYHYTFAHNSLPEETVLGAHSKRIAVYKIIKALAIMLAGFISIRIIDNIFYIIAVLVILVFIIAGIFTFQVKDNDKKEYIVNKKSYAKVLNIFKYSRHMKICMIMNFLSKFAITSLVVLLSIKIIDDGLSFETLKIVKSIVLVISAVGFFCSSYFIKKKKIVLFDIISKICVIITLPFIFVVPEVCFVVIICKGLTEPFGTMANFSLLKLKKEENLDLSQQELVVNLFSYFAGMISGMILININFVLAIILVCITLIISVTLEILLNIKKTNNSIDLKN